MQYTPAPDQTITEIVDAAVEIEAMGFSCFSLPDHLTRSHNGVAVPVPDPVALLGRLAADTHSISLGTMTLLDALRLPIQTVRTAATLQHITAGRYELGIGAGWQQTDLDALPTPAADVRIAALRTTLALLRDAWPADPDMIGSASLTRTMAEGVLGPRVVVAAGSQQMLRLAASTADTIALTVPTRSRLAGVAPSATSVAAQIALAQAFRPNSMPPVEFHLQIRAVSREAPESSDRDWWAIGGSPCEIADAVHRRAEAGIGYLSVCTQDLRLLEHLASQVLPLCEG